MSSEHIRPSVEDIQLSSRDREVEPNRRTNIILIGMPRSGKTTVGRILADKLGFDFVDTDQEIERREGMSVADIFATKGQAYFRAKETEVAKEVLQKKNQVVPTGGGMVENKGVISHFFREGRVYYLKTPLRTLAERAFGDNTRPATTDEQDEVLELSGRLTRRKDTYEMADKTVETAGKTEEEVALEIMLDYAESLKKETTLKESSPVELAK